MNVLFIKNMMKVNLIKKTVSVLAVASSLLFVSNALAAIKDLEQEIIIVAESQDADLKNKIISYLDNVIIRQGSISITADVVKVFSQVNKKNDEKNETYLAKGKPAIFEQQLEDGSLITLQADEITYSPNSNTIIISGNALVKQAGSEVSGNEITYNTVSEKLQARSANNQPVTTILQPTVLKKQKETYEKSKEEKPTDKVVEKEGDSSDN